MPDKSQDFDFLSIDDLIDDDASDSGARPVRKKAAASARTAGKPRQIIVQRRRKPGGDRGRSAAIVGVLLIGLAVAMVLFFSPPSQAPAPAVPAPRVYAVPPMPVPPPDPPLQASAEPPAPQPAPVSAPDPDGTPADPSAEDLETSVRDFLAVWEAAWEGTAGPSGDPAPYQAAYGPDFTHAGVDRAAWLADKARKNSRKAWIRISLSDIRVTPPTEGAPVRVTFQQEYASSNYSEVSEKTLLLHSADGAWQIVGIE